MLCFVCLIDSLLLRYLKETLKSYMEMERWLKFGSVQGDDTIEHILDTFRSDFAKLRLKIFKYSANINWKSIFASIISLNILSTEIFSMKKLFRKFFKKFLGMKMLFPYSSCGIFIFNFSRFSKTTWFFH